MHGDDDDDDDKSLLLLLLTDCYCYTYHNSDKCNGDMILIQFCPIDNITDCSDGEL